MIRLLSRESEAAASDGSMNNWIKAESSQKVLFKQFFFLFQQSTLPIEPRKERTNSKT